MNERLLYEMYQQWQQGKENIADEWVEFVELVSKELGTTEDTVIRSLQKYAWFTWNYSE
jgi:hypothetical protein